MELKRIIGGLFFIVAGLILMLNSQVSNVGAVIGLAPVSSSVSLIVGLIFLIVGILMFEAVRKKESELEKKLGIRPKKELTHLSNKQRSFRKKLVNLYDMQKPIDNQKIAYLLPEYEKVRKTNEKVKGSRVYQGRKDGKEEYFTIDISRKHMAKLELDPGEIRLLPTHIDIQEKLGPNKYKHISKEKIDWKKMIRESGAFDIFRYFVRKRKK